MKTILISALMCASLVTGCAFHASHASDKPSPATLAVSAEGVLRLEPDMAVVTLAVETAGESLPEIQDANRAKMQTVINRLLDLGIPEKHLSTSAFTVIPKYAREPRDAASTEPSAPRILGYTVVNQLQVEVHDVDAMGRVLDRALAAGANRFSGLRWEVKDEHGARLQALEAAGTKAREKAATLARTLELRLVRLLEVQEGGVHISPRQPRMAMSLRESVATDGNLPLSPGEIEVQATVRLLYEIAPGTGDSQERPRQASP